MKAWIFDVDGVLSNLETRHVTEPSLLPFLKQILEQEDILACNTGRDTMWVTRNLLKPLEDLGVSSLLLKDIFLACEKGGTWQEADKPLQINEQFSLPLPLVEKVQLLIIQEFADSMFFDEQKRTMISIEMKQGISRDHFIPRQQKLKTILAMYLQMAGLSSQYTIQEDLIATDIIHKNAGKDVSMQHILTWSETRGHRIEHFYCFGDNPSDTHMGNLLQENNLPFTFVYVGSKPLPNLPFTPVLTQEKFDKGTAEALTKLL